MELGDLEQDLVSRCETYLQNSSSSNNASVDGAKAALTFACILRRVDFVKLILEQGVVGDIAQSLDNTLEDTLDLVAIHSPFPATNDHIVSTLQLLLGRIQPTAFNLQNALHANQLSAAQVYLKHTNGALAFKVDDASGSNLLPTWRVAAAVWTLLTAHEIPRLGLHSALRRLPTPLLGRLAVYMLL